MMQSVNASLPVTKTNNKYNTMKKIPRNNSKSSIGDTVIKAKFFSNVHDLYDQFHLLPVQVRAF